MDIETGKIYNTIEEAIAAGVLKENLVQGPKKTLNRLQKKLGRLKMKSKYETERRRNARKRQKMSRRRNKRR